jgi:hypothetical protein
MPGFSLYFLFMLGPPPTTNIMSSNPAIKNPVTARIAGLWLLKTEDIYPKTSGPNIADEQRVLSIEH